MSQSTSILLVCPACKSRRQVPRSMIGQRVRCRQCTAELTVDPPATDDDDLLLADEPTPPAAATPVISNTATAISVDDIPLSSPLAEPSAALSPQASTEADYRVGPPPAPSPEVKKVVQKSPAPAQPHDNWVKPPEKKTLGWTFLSGIFFYFLRPSALAQWLMLSVGIFVSLWLMTMSTYALGAAYVGSAGAVCFAIAGFLIGIAAYSYASGCFVAIIENTAYHLDKEDRWPDPDYREWLFQLVRMIYLGVLCSLFAAPLGYVVSLTDPTIGGWVASIASDLFFPILLLSALEANSVLLPFSPPILRSLIEDWRAWITFYAVTILFTTAIFFAILLIFERSPVLPPLLVAPLLAAVIFSYARLIGRLASYIMHLDEKELRESPKESKRISEFDPPEFDLKI